jgi:hypothetical protein
MVMAKALLAVILEALLVAKALLVAMAPPPEAFAVTFEPGGSPSMLMLTSMATLYMLR